MRVFVTGASGHVASALVPELIAAGHEVVGLARSDAAAGAVAAMGAEVRRGDLDDVEGLAAAASAADGVVHLAFKHELDDLAAAAGADLQAVRAMGGALSGSGKPFVVTSGTLLLAFAAPGRVGTEKDTLASGPRVDAENEVVAMAERGVRTGIVRLPPITHSDLDHHGFAHRLIAAARQHGVAAYVGDGSNRWPAVTTRDAARLYRLVLEQGAAGSRWHAVAEEGVAFREIAEAIGDQLGLPTKSIAAEEAGEHFGFIGSFVGLDGPASSERTRSVLGWQPTGAGLVDDLEHGHYFAGAR